MAHVLIDRHHQTHADRVLPRPWLSEMAVGVYEPRRPHEHVDGPARLATAAGLIVRSVTRVDQTVLSQAPRLRAIATCSSGVDHLDLRAIAAAGVEVFDGRGGNAIAVMEWVIWALSRQWQISQLDRDALAGKKVVVVGVGAVGQAVMTALQALGAQTVAVDPPRAARESGFQGVTLQEALAAGCDALTLHVPLVHVGPHPTVRLLGSAELAMLGDSVLLNAARGGVLDERAAVAKRRHGTLSGLWLDTFDNEPQPSAEVLTWCDGATPHVAGHSVQGKLKVAAKPVSALRAALGLSALPALHLERRSERHPFDVLDETSARLRAGADFLSLRAGHVRDEGLSLTSSRS